MSNDLFVLGWLEHPKLVTGCLAVLREKAAHYRLQGAFEADTQAMFVEPMLRGLGWDTLDHEQVDREYNRPRATIGTSTWAARTFKASGRWQQSWKSSAWTRHCTTWRAVLIPNLDVTR